MLATLKTWRVPTRDGRALLTFLFIAAWTTPALTQSPPLTAGASSNRVHRLYVETAKRWQQNSNSGAAASEFARASFDWADYATNDTQRAAVAEQGIAASRRAIALEPDSAAARLYLGLNLGQLARTKLFSALGLLHDMEATWMKAIELDPKFNYAGAHRALGLLYLEAPGWPISLGSHSKARQHLKKAVELHPEYPDNQLCWLEALLKWDEMKTVLARTNTVEAVMTAAQTKFTGEEWKRDWEDWEDHWRKIKARISPASPRAFRSKE
jgi:tetratricopeptide (TPR) repeat protein